MSKVLHSPGTDRSNATACRQKNDHQAKFKHFHLNAEGTLLLIFSLHNDPKRQHSVNFSTAVKRFFLKT